MKDKLSSIENIDDMSDVISKYFTEAENGGAYNDKYYVVEFDYNGGRGKAYGHSECSVYLNEKKDKLLLKCYEVITADGNRFYNFVFPFPESKENNSEIREMREEEIEWFKKQF